MLARRLLRRWLRPQPSIGIGLSQLPNCTSSSHPGMKSSPVQNVYLAENLWALGVLAVKIGVLLFYARLFTIGNFRRWVIAAGAFVTATHVSIIIAQLFQCTPVSHFWTAADGGHCINEVAFYLASGCLNIVGDVLVVSLPIRPVWQLRTSLGMRVALLFLFCLGGL